MAPNKAFYTTVTFLVNIFQQGHFKSKNDNPKLRHIPVRINKPQQKSINFQHI